jgi:hypothetical protein
MKKYTLFVNRFNYGKYINDELAVSCYWTKRYTEGLELIDEIINETYFIHHKHRLEINKQYIIDAM